MKRYKHLLVPLDGSELAELALTDALDLAQMTGAELTLLQVIRPIEHVLAADTGHPIYIDQQFDSQKMLALGYLNSVCERIDCYDLPINRVVEMGSPADTIIDYANQHTVDVIIMATHGRSGLQRWVYGSVADKVLRGANVPILLVRAHPQQAEMV